MTPEDEEFNRIEKESRTRQEYVRSMTQPQELKVTKPWVNSEMPPKYSFKTHWEKDGRIGVVASIVRPDGGIHLLQDIIDPPKREWVGLTDHEFEEATYGMEDLEDCWIAIEDALRKKNNA